MKENIYTLTLTWKEGQGQGQRQGETVIGMFSSLAKVKECVKTLPKKNQYKTYKFPVNRKITKGKKLSDEMENYLCHYFGTFVETCIEVDENESVTKESERKVVFWPKD